MRFATPGFDVAFYFYFANVIQTARVQQFLLASSTLFDVSGGMRPVRSKRTSYRRRANDHNLPIPASLLPIPFCSSRSNFQTPLSPAKASIAAGKATMPGLPSFFFLDVRVFVKALLYRLEERTETARIVQMSRMRAISQSGCRERLLGPVFESGLVLEERRCRREANGYAGFRLETKRAPGTRHGNAQGRSNYIPLTKRNQLSTTTIFASRLEFTEST